MDEPPARTPLWHLLFNRRIRWGLTWRGWLLGAILAAALGWGGVRLVHPFLALHRPVEADVLVIEGWIPEYAIARTAEFVRSGNYTRVLTVGGPVTGAPSPANDDDTHAYVAVRNLRKQGLSGPTIELVPSNHANRDRTYQSAADLRRWLERNRIVPRGVNVVTLGPHARRTRLLFQRALGDSFPVGVIALKNAEYDPEQWWRYSEGVKEVFAESVAYLYVRCWFSPADR